jgi:HEAT repeat protein
VLATHPSPAVRAQICLALGRLGSERALPELVDVLRDGDPELRDKAAQALHEITGLEVADPRDWPDVLEPRLATARG